MDKHDFPDEYKQLATRRDAYLSRADPFSGKEGFELHDRYVADDHGKPRTVIWAVGWAAGILIFAGALLANGSWPTLLIVTGLMLAGIVLLRGIRRSRSGE